jgi:ABC-type lipoprotein release transport system permease subunit
MSQLEKRTGTSDRLAAGIEFHTLAAALVIVIAVGGAADLTPGWRASRIDPNTAIRHE